MSNEPTKKPDTLGRLKSFGLSEMWQVALLLPLGWDDMTRVIERFDCQLDVGSPCLLKGKLSGTPTVRFDGAAPRLIGFIMDPVGRKIGFSMFGDSREFQAELKDNQSCLYLYGQVDSYNDSYWLKNPEVVDERWVGRLRPRYPGKTGVIKPDTVRDRVVRELRRAIPIAAEYLAGELSSFGDRAELAKLGGVPGWTLENILTQAHVPRTTEYGKKAQLSLDYLAAFGIIKAAAGSHDASGVAPHPLMLGDWRKRAASIPFALTDEQERSIAETLADLAGPTPMRRVLSGDVGTGKTAVYGTVAAVVVDGFGTAVILLPNESLAAQVYREFKEWWPDLPIQLVTGSTKGEVCAPLVVGTTATLFRDTGSPNLFVSDEQQKFSVEQRDALVGPETHHLEVTATCIPRTQALVRYGVVKVSKLTKSHTPKNIHTKIWQEEQWGEVAAGIKATIVAGGQVLYVYPLREKGEQPEMGDEEENPGPTSGRPELKSAAEVFDKWEKLFPGRARLIHGQMTAADKESALADMRSGAAAVLIATTVIEVGMNLPLLRRVVVIHPERFGVSTLHQIRGRVARHGGVGYCDLFLPNPVKETTMERLRILERTQDGFTVAEHDMRLRGVGDLSRISSRQSGADLTFFFGRPVSVEALDAVMIKMDEMGEPTCRP